MASLKVRNRLWAVLVMCDVSGAQQMEAIINVINEGYCAHLQPPRLAPGTSLLLDEADQDFPACTSCSVIHPHIFTVFAQTLSLLPSRNLSLNYGLL